MAGVNLMDKFRNRCDNQCSHWKAGALPTPIGKGLEVCTYVVMKICKKNLNQLTILFLQYYFFMMNW